MGDTLARSELSRDPTETLLEPGTHLRYRVHPICSMRNLNPITSGLSKMQVLCSLLGLPLTLDASVGNKVPIRSQVLGYPN